MQHYESGQDMIPCNLVTRVAPELGGAAVVTDTRNVANAPPVAGGTSASGNSVVEAVAWRPAPGHSSAPGCRRPVRGSRPCGGTRRYRSGRCRRLGGRRIEVLPWTLPDAIAGVAQAGISAAGSRLPSPAVTLRSGTASARQQARDNSGRSRSADTNWVTGRSTPPKGSNGGQAATDAQEADRTSKRGF